MRLTTTKRPRRQPRQRRQHQAASTSPRVSRPRDPRPRLSREGSTRPTFSLFISVRLTLFSRRPGRSRAPSDPRSRSTMSTKRSTSEHRAASRPRTGSVLFVCLFSLPTLRASLHTAHTAHHICAQGVWRFCKAKFYGDAPYFSSMGRRAARSPKACPEPLLH